VDYKLKVNGRVVAIFENYQNALAVVEDLGDSDIFGIKINNEWPYFLDFDESKTTFKQFSGV